MFLYFRPTSRWQWHDQWYTDVPRTHQSQKHIPLLRPKSVLFLFCGPKPYENGQPLLLGFCAVSFSSMNMYYFWRHSEDFQNLTVCLVTALWLHEKEGRQNRVTENRSHSGTRQVATPKNTQHWRGRWRHICKSHCVKKAREEQCAQHAIIPAKIQSERRDGDVGEAVPVGAGVRGNSVLCSLCCEPKTPLKNSLFSKK